MHQHRAGSINQCIPITQFQPVKYFHSWPLEAEELCSFIEKVGISRCGQGLRMISDVLMYRVGRLKEGVTAQAQKLGWRKLQWFTFRGCWEGVSAEICQ